MENISKLTFHLYHTGKSSHLLVYSAYLPSGKVIYESYIECHTDICGSQCLKMCRLYNYQMFCNGHSLKSKTKLK